MIRAQPIACRVISLTSGAIKGLAECDAALGASANDAIPGNATRILFTPETANVRVADTALASANLTASVGSPRTAGTTYSYEGDLSLLKFCGTGTGKVWVEFYT